MKFLANDALTGHKNVALTLTTAENDEVELTVRRLLMFTATTMECETAQEWRKVAEIIETFEKEDEDNQDYVAVENDHWDMLSARLNQTLPRVYRIHSPFVLDQLDDLINKGKPSDKKNKK